MPNSPVADESVRVAVAAGVAEKEVARKAAKEAEEAARNAARKAARKAASRALAAASADEVITAADVRGLFEGESDDEDLVRYNKKCQAERAEAKRLLAKKKEEALAAEKKKKEAVAKRKKEAAAKRERKKKETAAKREKKKKQAAAKKTQGKDSPALKKYITAMGEAAVAASKAVSVEDRNKADCLFKIGQNVSGYWPAIGEDGGGWFNGTVVSIDYVHRTVHIRYEDGDSDNAVPWHNARILDDLSDEDERADESDEDERVG